MHVYVTQCSVGRLCSCYHGLCRRVVAPCFLVPRIVVCEPGWPSHGPEEGRERGGERGGEREGGERRERGRERGREREREGDGLVKESLPSEISLPLPELTPIPGPKPNVPSPPLWHTNRSQSRSLTYAVPFPLWSISH